MDKDGVEVQWRDDLPRRMHLLAEGLPPRLWVNRAWWARADVGERRQAVNELTVGIELPGVLLWMSGGGVAAEEARLRWVSTMPLAWWEALLAEEG